MFGSSGSTVELVNQRGDDNIANEGKAAQVHPDSNREESGGTHHGDRSPVYDVSASSAELTGRGEVQPRLDNKWPSTGASIGSKRQHKVEQGIKQVVATPEQIDRTPVGNSNHRIWRCQAEPMEEARGKWSRAVDRRKVASPDVAGHPAWEGGLMPKPLPPKTAIAETDSFRWIVQKETCSPAKSTLMARRWMAQTRN